MFCCFFSCFSCFSCCFHSCCSTHVTACPTGENSTGTGCAPQKAA